MSSGVNLAGAARSGMISLAGSGVAAVAGLLLNVVIGRGLGASASGAFFVTVAVLTVAATVSKLGADTGLVWALSRARTLDRRHDVRRFLTVAMVPSVLAGGLLAVAVFTVAPWIGALVGHGAGVETLLRIGAPYLLIAGPCLVLAAGLRGLGSVVAFTGVQNVLIPTLRTLLAWLAVAAGFGLTGAMLSWNAPLVLGTAIAAWLVSRRTRQLESGPVATTRPSATSASVTRPSATSDVAREFWSFSALRSVAAVLEVGIVWTDVIIVATLTSPREAGIYAAASRFITTGSLAEAAMRVAMAPQISRLLAVDDRAGAGRLCAVATQWIVLLAWPLYLVLALYAPYVLSVFGPEFSQGAVALTVLALAMIVVMSAGNNQTVLLMSGRSGTQMWNKAAALTTDVVLNLLLVPHWGMNGAAVAWAVTVLLDAGLVLGQVRHLLGVRIPMDRVWPAMGLAATAFVPLGLVTRGVVDTGSGWWMLPLAASLACFGVLLRRYHHRLDVEPLRRAMPGGVRG